MSQFPSVGSLWNSIVAYCNYETNRTDAYFVWQRKSRAAAKNISALRFNKPNLFNTKKRK